MQYDFINDDTYPGESGGGSFDEPNYAYPAQDDGFRFNTFQAHALTTLNRASPGTYPDDLIRRAWADATSDPSDFPALKARYNIPDGHILDLAHRVSQEQATPRSWTADAGQFPTTLLSAGQSQPGEQAGGQNPSLVGEIVEGIKDSPPGRFVKGFMEMPKNGPDPYEGMSDAERYGRITGESALSWDAWREAGKSSKEILDKRMNGQDPTKDELEASKRAWDKALLGTVAPVIGGKIGGATAQGIGKLTKKFF